MSTRLPIGRIVLALSAALAFGCAKPEEPSEPPAPESTGGRTGGAPTASGGKTGTSSGGSTGSATGGSTGQGGTGGTSGGAGGSAGGAGGGAGGAGGSPIVDAAPPAEAGGVDTGGGSSDTGAGSSDAPIVSDPKQGPVAEGKVVFSRDFEDGNMEGLSRSPNGLPEDRVQMIDDPIKQRGKVVRIHFQQGDNFRTSPGTEPRSWFSAAKGYTVRPGTTVSVAWGFMWENVNMGAHFAQIIRDGGPLWMFGVDQGGTVAARVHRGSGGPGGIMKLEPMKWYDFRVDTVYRGGGEIRFYVNGKLVGTGRGDGGAPARFDCGIYWMHNAKPTRTVYVSNISIAEQ